MVLFMIKYISANALTLDGIKLILWLDLIRDVIAGFYRCTYTSSCFSQIVFFELISSCDIMDHEKSNLYTFDLCILYL